MEVEGRAHAHEQRCTQARAHAVHPQLLLGLPRADPHHLGARLVDRRDRTLVLRRGRLVEGRREALFGDAQLRAASRRRSFIGDGVRGTSPVQIDRRPAASRARAEGQHQVRSVDARGARVPQRPQRPHERLAVGDRQRGLQHRRPRGRVLARAHHEVHRGRREIAAPVGRHEGLHPVHDALVVADRERYAENLRAGRQRRGCGLGERGDALKIPAPLARRRARPV